jgi:hypothetical protein
MGKPPPSQRGENSVSCCGYVLGQQYRNTRHLFSLGFLTIDLV